MSLPFLFIDGAPPQNALVIPARILSKDALLQCLSHEMPPHFGFNWDALYDGLTDREGLVLHHEALPALPAADLKVYLEVLADAAALFAITVRFPLDAEDAVRASSLAARVTPTTGVRVLARREGHADDRSARPRSPRGSRRRPE